MDRTTKTVIVVSSIAIIGVVLIIVITALVRKSKEKKEKASEADPENFETTGDDPATTSQVREQAIPGGSGSQNLAIQRANMIKASLDNIQANWWNPFGLLTLPKYYDASIQALNKVFAQMYQKDAEKLREMYPKMYGKQLPDALREKLAPKDASRYINILTT